MRKLSALLMIAVFITIILVPHNTTAAYSLSMTGTVDFLAEAFSPEIYNGSVIVALGPESPSEVEVVLSVSGEVEDWLTWSAGDTFTLYPSESFYAYFSIDFPSLPPGEYSGLIMAYWASPEQTNISGGAGATGNLAVAIGVSVNIPTDLMIRNQAAGQTGAEILVVNQQNVSFSGFMSYNLSQDGDWIETITTNITDLSAYDRTLDAVTWSNSLDLGVYYDIVFTLFDLNTTHGVEYLYFRLPTPADIVSISHRPTVVYADYDANLVAKVYDSQNGQTECTAYYTVDGGDVQSGLMVYDSDSDEYLLLIDNTSYQDGSYVEYWVTSYNDASGNAYSGLSGTGFFLVFSSTAPDLVIDGTSIFFSPIDPIIEMYDSNITNIFVTVRNSGRADVTSVVVELFDYNTSIARETVVSIAAGDSSVVRFNWGTPSAGTHLLRFVVDPDDVYVETNENNNYYAVEVEIEEAPYVPPPPPTGSTTDAIPYIIIPIILFIIILLLFFRHKKSINVTVAETKPFKHPKKGTMRWTYICSYGDGIVLGSTKSTDIHAEVGSLIKVKPTGIHETEDGTLEW
ncbi:MAG: hypothetical protein KAJ33_03675, partial [Thermoplasmata archaeon]|nr:hypothetical protein [Thermoplasmata archaeon]